MSQKQFEIQKQEFIAWYEKSNECHLCCALDRYGYENSFTRKLRKAIARHVSPGASITFVLLDLYPNIGFTSGSKLRIKLRIRWMREYVNYD